MVQGEISEADTPTIKMGATPSGLFSDPSQLSPCFYARCPSCPTLPLYPGLGQAPNMLACMPNGVVH